MDVHRGGLEATVGYKPERDSGTFSYAAHAVTVVVDPELGHVEILDYVVVEDGGKPAAGGAGFPRVVDIGHQFRTGFDKPLEAFREFGVLFYQIPIKNRRRA